MRLLLVIYGSLDQQSGGYRYDARFVGYMRQRGHEVQLFSQRGGSYVSRMLQDRPSSLIAAIERFKPHVIVEDELNHPSLIRANRRSHRKSALPIVSVVHHLSAEEEHRSVAGAVIKSVERRYLRTLDAGIFNTQATADSVERLLGRPLPGVVCPPSVDGLRSIASQPKGEMRRWEDSLRLLTVGSLIRRKRMDAVVRAVAEAQDSGITLTIVGNEEAEPRTAGALHSLVRDLGVEQQIRFAGSLDFSALEQVYREHDLFVLPSQHEGFGMVYLEAMAYGMPVIATQSGGASSLVRHGGNGYLCAPVSASDVLRFVRELRCDSEKLAELSEGALKTAAAHPSWEESFAAAEAFIADLTAGRSDHSRV